MNTQYVWIYSMCITLYIYIYIYIQMYYVYIYYVVPDKWAVSAFAYQPSDRVWNPGRGKIPVATKNKIGWNRTQLRTTHTCVRLAMGSNACGGSHLSSNACGGGELFGTSPPLASFPYLEACLLWQSTRQHHIIVLLICVSKILRYVLYIWMTCWSYISS